MARYQLHKLQKSLTRYFSHSLTFRSCPSIILTFHTASFFFTPAPPFSIYPTHPLFSFRHIPGNPTIYFFPSLTPHYWTNLPHPHPRYLLSLTPAWSVNFVSLLSWGHVVVISVGICQQRHLAHWLETCGHVFIEANKHLQIMKYTESVFDVFIASYKGRCPTWSFWV